MSELTANQKDKLMTDLRVVVADAEELLKLTAGDLNESTAGLRERLQQRLSDAKHSLLTLQATASQRRRPPAMPPTTMCTTTPGARSPSAPASAWWSGC